MVHVWSLTVFQNDSTANDADQHANKDIIRQKTKCNSIKPGSSFKTTDVTYVGFTEPAALSSHFQYRRPLQAGSLTPTAGASRKVKAFPDKRWSIVDVDMNGIGHVSVPSVRAISTCQTAINVSLPIGFMVHAPILVSYPSSCRLDEKDSEAICQ